MTALYDRMYDLVVKGTNLAGTHVMPANDRGVSPKETYAEILVVDDRQHGYATRQVVQGTTTAYTTLRYAIIQVTLYRVEALARAKRLAAWLYSDEALELENDLELAVRNVGAVRDMTDTVETERETRAVLDLEISYYYNVQVDEPLVDIADIIIKHDNFDAETVEVMDDT